jgi:hypothetical protein
VRQEPVFIFLFIVCLFLRSPIFAYCQRKARRACLGFVSRDQKWPKEKRVEGNVVDRGRKKKSRPSVIFLTLARQDPRLRRTIATAVGGPGRRGQAPTRQLWQASPRPGWTPSSSREGGPSASAPASAPSIARQRDVKSFVGRSRGRRGLGQAWSRRREASRSPRRFRKRRRGHLLGVLSEFLKSPPTPVFPPGERARAREREVRPELKLKKKKK